MAATELAPPSGAEGVTWDLSDLLDGRTDEAAVDELLDRADGLAATLAEARGGVAGFDAAALADFMARLAELHEVLGRAGSFASLRFAADVTDPTRGALVQRVQERATAIGTTILFFDLEWAGLDDDAVEALLADDRLGPFRHHLAAERRYRPYLLSEPEERILTEKAVTGRSAWSRLFSELTSTLDVRLDGRQATLEEALARLAASDREVRRATAEAVTEALAPGLRTRAYLYNTLLHDKAVDDRLRGYPTWATSRNLSNEASDESVAALVEAVRRRYDIPHRWYALKARLLGLDRLADYDRAATPRRLRRHHRLGRGSRSWCSTATPRSRPSWPTPVAASSTATGSTPPPAPASARAPSARTPCRRCTPTSSSTTRPGVATCSRWPTSWATACTPTWPGPRACSTRGRR